MTATRATGRTRRQAAQDPFGLFDADPYRRVAGAVAAGGGGDAAVPLLALQQLPRDTTNDLCALKTTERI